MSQFKNLSKWFMGTAILFALLYVFCTKDNPTSLPYEDDTDTWTMTIDVLDGVSGEPIQATVQYTNRKGENVIDTTDSSGHISISGNAPGKQSFAVAFLRMGGQSTASKTQAASAYTQVVVTASNGEQILGDAALDKHARLSDQSAVVKLYPLTGSLSGMVKTKINNLRMPVAAESVVVSITYDDKSMGNATPRSFETVTNANGVFSFSNLPVAPGLKVAIASKTINTMKMSIHFPL